VPQNQWWDAIDGARKEELSQFSKTIGYASALVKFFPLAAFKMALIRVHESRAFWPRRSAILQADGIEIGLVKRPKNARAFLLRASASRKIFGIVASSGEWISGVPIGHNSLLPSIASRSRPSFISQGLSTARRGTGLISTKGFSARCVNRDQDSSNGPLESIDSTIRP